jgi:hypothetical protein
MQSTFFFALVGLLRTLTLAVVFTLCPTLRVDCAEAATGTERATRQKTIPNFFNILKIFSVSRSWSKRRRMLLKTIRARLEWAKERRDMPQKSKGAAASTRVVPGR